MIFFFRVDLGKGEGLAVRGRVPAGTEEVELQVITQKREEGGFPGGLDRGAEPHPLPDPEERFEVLPFGGEIEVVVGRHYRRAQEDQGLATDQEIRDLPLVKRPQELDGIDADLTLHGFRPPSGSVPPSCAGRSTGGVPRARASETSRGWPRSPCAPGDGWGGPGSASAPRSPG